MRRGPIPEDLVGRRFGKLVVVDRAAPPVRDNLPRVWWLCRCDCGKVKPMRSGTVRTALSCGCTKRCTGRHGHARRGRESSTWSAWHSMIQRCTDTKWTRYADYGGRGITVCERWRTFENFLADMGDRPTEKTLDRIDNDKGYEPGNCRWATALEQANNKRSTVFVTIGERTMSAAEWERSSGVRAGSIRARVHRGLVGTEAVYGSDRRGRRAA